MDANAVAGAPQPQGRPSITSMLLMCMLLWFMTRPDGEASLAAQNEARDALASAQYTYGNYSAWLNGTQTNYTEEAVPKAIGDLARVAVPSSPDIDYSRASYWHNLTGFWSGPPKWYNLSSENLQGLPTAWDAIAKEVIKGVNRTDAAEKAGSLNWTTVNKAEFRVNDVNVTVEEEIQTITGQLGLHDPEEEIAKFRFDGLHFPAQGTLYVLVMPIDERPDIRILPTLVPKDWHDRAARVVENQMKLEVERLQERVDLFLDVERDETAIASTSCSFYFYGSLTPNPVSSKLMADLEAELKHPTGITTIRRPPLIMDAIMISSRCGIAVEMEGLTGLTVDHFWRKVSTYAGLASLVYLALLCLLVRQMEDTRNPSAISSVSSWAIVGQAILDAFGSSSHIMFGIMAKHRAALSMVVPGFLACILALMFEVRFTSLIHRIQGPEDALLFNPRPPLAASLSATPATVDNAQIQTPAPTQPRLSPLLAFRRFTNRFLDLDGRGWLFLLLIFTWLVTLSSKFFVVSIWAFHSFWVPQIVRNIMRGTRKALSKTYVIGTSVLRSLLLLYIFACPDNILLWDGNRMVYPLVGWVTFQAIVLIGQEYMGASFFIPKGWVTMPEVYNYHPNLISDPEAPEQELGDCAICMEPIIVKPETSGVPGFGAGEKAESVGTGASLLLNVGLKRHYAMTPCSHIMHTACLEQWMRVKNICPSCRTPLPPL